MMIELKDIHKSYGSLQVLKGINLSVEKGAVATIVGASGAGKSTLLHIIGTLDSADKGEVCIGGKPLNRLSEKELAQFRNQHIGFVFQFHHLLPEFTALENVCMPACLGGMNRKEAEGKAMELLKYLNLENRATHKPSELSGGEQQRVAVARALINRPDVVLADEPSGNLDSENAKSLHRLFFDLRDTFGQTFVIVTHNNELAAASDFQIHIKDGVIVDSL